MKTPRKLVLKTAIPAAVLAKLAEGGAGAFIAFVEKQQPTIRRSDIADSVAMNLLEFGIKREGKRKMSPLSQESTLYQLEMFSTEGIEILGRTVGTDRFIQQ